MRPPAPVRRAKRPSAEPRVAAARPGHAARSRAATAPPAATARSQAATAPPAETARCSRPRPHRPRRPLVHRPRPPRRAAFRQRDRRGRLATGGLGSGRRRQQRRCTVLLENVGSVRVVPVVRAGIVARQTVVLGHRLLRSVRLERSRAFIRTALRRFQTARRRTLGDSDGDGRCVAGLRMVEADTRVSVCGAAIGTVAAPAIDRAGPSSSTAPLAFTEWRRPRSPRPPDPGRRARRRPAARHLCRCRIRSQRRRRSA